jgi:hypothetical protein
MFERPYGFIGRVILAACAVSLGATSLSAQSTTNTKSADSSISRADIFTGYSYYGTHGTNKPSGINYSSIDLGAIGSFAYYANKYAGGEVELASHPDGQNDGLTTISAGPIFRLPLQDMTPFVHGLVGAARLGGPNSDAGGYHNPYRWGTALTVGGGIDYALPFFKSRLGLRLFQADYQYVHASFGPSVTPPTGGPIGGRANLSSAQLSTGLLFHLGSIVPPPPVTYSCAASPSTVYPGDPITVTGTAANLNPKKTATYTWTTDGGKISGTSSTANIDTADAQPGSYTAHGHVTEGDKAGQSADCSATYTVKAYEPPTISCSANPSTVKPGDSATITSVGVSPQNRPLTYSYSASAGTVSGSGTAATLNTAGAAPGTITVTCNAVDDKGHSASATTDVTVEAPPPPPAPEVMALCVITFDRDHRRPTRVDNEAKACLDDIALSLLRSADSKAVLVSSSTDKEKKVLKRRSRHADVNRLAEERAVNTKAYLTKEKGIDPSRIELFTGSDDSTAVKTTLVPSGASLDTSSYAPVDESKLAAPHRVVRHHVKKK